MVWSLCTGGQWARLDSIPCPPHSASSQPDTQVLQLALESHDTRGEVRARAHSLQAGCTITQLIAYFSCTSVLCAWHHAGPGEVVKVCDKNAGG